MSIEDKFLKARAKLLMEQPFFGTLALRLKVIETEDIDTAATDGTRLMYNAKFVEKLTPHELVGLIAHEVLHCVFNHMTRRQEHLERCMRLRNQRPLVEVQLHSSRRWCCRPRR